MRPKSLCLPAKTGIIAFLSNANSSRLPAQCCSDEQTLELLEIPGVSQLPLWIPRVCPHDADSMALGHTCCKGLLREILLWTPEFVVSCSFSSQRIHLEEAESAQPPLTLAQPKSPTRPSLAGSVKEN